jgi:hypothetical protein
MSAVLEVPGDFEEILSQEGRRKPDAAGPARTGRQKGLYWAPPPHPSPNLAALKVVGFLFFDRPVSKVSVTN